MQKKRVLYFDVLNILACIAVISLHHNGVVHTYSNSWTWKTALIVETGAYWAVPVFLMLSGATLMNYRENYDTVTFFKKRFSRAVLRSSSEKRLRKAYSVLPSTRMRVLS